MLASNSSINVYPNPVNEKGIFIKNGMLEDSRISIKLTDMLGQLIQENVLQVNPLGDIQFIEFTNQVSVGVYQLQIRNNQKLEVVKLIVK
jgi:hypothetical protein